MSMEQTEDFKEKKTATTNLKCNIVPLSGFDNPAFVKEQETTEANANSDQCAFYEKIDYNDTKATVVLTGNAISKMILKFMAMKVNKQRPPNSFFHERVSQLL